ncbi:hypothetical protein [Streptomyces sp. NPDC005989]|uniref:hypothetical protein n=1 Tax=Streptomyces sp. NPDC005989 TaxID=3156727 RepID=UPI0033E4D793
MRYRRGRAAGARPLRALYGTDGPAPGVLSFTRAPLDPAAESPQPLREWTDDRLLRRAFCFRAGGTAAYAPAKAVDGCARPYAGPHMRVSGPLRDGLGAWLELAWPGLAWPQPVTSTALRIVVEATNGAPSAHVVAVRAYA